MAVPSRNNPNLLPPHSLEMEQATLGSVILDGRKLDAVADIIRTDDFYREAHRTIFESMLTLRDRSMPVDIATITEQLHQQNRLESVGGPEYLFQLTGSVPSSANAEHYAHVVEEKGTLRRLHFAGMHVQGLAHSEFETMGDLLNNAEQTVFAVAQRRLQGGFKHIKPLLDDVMDRIDQLSTKPSGITGLQTGLTRLDGITAGFQPKDLIIIAARPSMGKTALAMGIAQFAAIHNNKTVAIFSIEMSAEQLCLRMISSEARVNSHRLRLANLSQDEWPTVGTATGRLATAPIYIDDSTDCTAADIRAKCMRLKQQQGLDLIVVDYLQLMRGHKKTENRTQEIGDISRALKALARDLAVPVVALAQLSREVEKRPDKHPMLSDLRESGSIEAEADIVLFIFRQGYYDRKNASENPEQDPNAETQQYGGTTVHPTELIVSKHRNGTTGTINVAFIPTCVRFDNLEN